MSDYSTDQLPATPRPMRAGFAQDLNAHLTEANVAQRRVRPANPRRWPLAGAGAAVLIAALALSPNARAGAEGFLNLFRVQRITAIAIDPARIEQMRNSGLTNANIESLIGDSLVEDMQATKAGAKPRPVASVAEASTATGLTVRVPAKASPSQIMVQDAQTLHFRGNVTRLNTLVQSLGVTDVALPGQLEGAIITVTKPAAVMMKFNEPGEGQMVLMQSHSPSVELPEGVALAQLGEIGLRVVGVAPDEAHRIAQTTDWNSTLLVPIPMNAASFRNVTLDNGAQALVITTGGTGATSVHNTDGQRQHTSIAWVEGDTVYAISGGFSANVVDVANSLK